MEKKETSNLPFHIKRLGTFLENVKVSPEQKKDLEMARNALKKILEISYDTGDTGVCSAVPVRFPDIL